MLGCKGSALCFMHSLVGAGIAGTPQGAHSFKISSSLTPRSKVGPLLTLKLSALSRPVVKPNALNISEGL